MDFMELVKCRQSCRQYLPKTVEQEKIEQCLEAARLAPSACNSQPWKFVIVDDPQLKTSIAEKTFGRVMSFNHFTMQAPILAIIVSERQNLTAKIGNIVRKKAFNQMDVAIAAEHFCLAATEQGMGTCILGWFDESAVKKILHIPKQKRIELIITAGYPASEEILPKKRKSLDQISSYNKYH